VDGQRRPPSGRVPTVRGLAEHLVSDDSHKPWEKP
jgi:hypothetical protein